MPKKKKAAKSKVAKKKKATKKKSAKKRPGKKKKAVKKRKANAKEELHTVTLPTEEELKALPLRAIVALAARCARRVQPLFNSRHSELIRTVDAAIAVAEEVASGKPVVRADRLASAADEASSLADFSRWDARRAAHSRKKNGFDAASSVADAAADFACAADAVALIDVSVALARAMYDATADLIGRDVYSHIPYMVSSGMESCVDAAAYVQAGNALADATRADYELLLSTSRQASRKLGDPVDLGEKGPLGNLWPDGSPDGWQAALDRVAKEIASSKSESELRDRAADPDDPVTKVFNRLKEVLEESLSCGEFQLFEDRYEPMGFGSRAIWYVGPKKAIGLSWDGKEQWFELSQCGVMHNYPAGRGRELAFERLEQTHSREDQDRIVTSITRSIRAFARQFARGGKSKVAKKKKATKKKSAEKRTGKKNKAVKKKPARSTPESTNLAVGVKKLRPLFAEHGFRYAPDHHGVSHGGQFATGVFRRGRLKIELIVRNRDELGCPNYTEGQGYVGHDDVFWALGREGEAQLVLGGWLSFRAKDGGDPFDALLVDLERVVLPALQRSQADFSAAIARAFRKSLDDDRVPDECKGNVRAAKEKSARNLAVGVEKLRPLLAEHGFQYDDSSRWNSMIAEPVAAGSFRRGNLAILLFVRNRDQLDCPDYSEGRWYAHHDYMFWALGREGEAQLVHDRGASFKAKDGGDPFDALLVDLERVILPALQRSEADFCATIVRACLERSDRIGIPDTRKSILRAAKMKNVSEWSRWRKLCGEKRSNRTSTRLICWNGPASKESAKTMSAKKKTGKKKSTKKKAAKKKSATGRSVPKTPREKRTVKRNR